MGFARFHKTGIGGKKLQYRKIILYLNMIFFQPALREKNYLSNLQSTNYGYVIPDPVRP